MITLARRRCHAALLAVGLVLAGGCNGALDQDQPTPPPPARPATGPAVATSDLGTVPPLPGLLPPPKPFVAESRFTGGPAQPSPLLLEHAVPEPAIPLSEYGRQPAHAIDDFDLGPALTGAALQRRFGPPAGTAVVDDPWYVYRVTFGRELWLHFADGGTGPLLAADLVRGREDGYSRDRLYPTR